MSYPSTSMYAGGPELPRASQAVFAELQAVERLLRAERAAHGETRQALATCHYQLSETRRCLATMVVAPAPAAAVATTTAATPVRLNLTVSSAGMLTTERKSRRCSEAAAAEVTAIVFNGELAQMEGQLTEMSKQRAASEVMLQRALTRESELDCALRSAKAKFTGELPALRAELRARSEELAVARGGGAEAAGAALGELVDELERARKAADEVRRGAARQLQHAQQSLDNAEHQRQDALAQRAEAIQEAEWQRHEGERQRQEAERQREEAERQRQEATWQRQEAERLRVREQDLSIVISRHEAQLHQCNRQLASQAAASSAQIAELQLELDAMERRSSEATNDREAAEAAQRELSSVLGTTTSAAAARAESETPPLLAEAATQVDVPSSIEVAEQTSAPADVASAAPAAPSNSERPLTAAVATGVLSRSRTVRPRVNIVPALAGVAPLLEGADGKPRDHSIGTERLMEADVSSVSRLSSSPPAGPSFVSPEVPSPLLASHQPPVSADPQRVTQQCAGLHHHGDAVSRAASSHSLGAMSARLGPTDGHWSTAPEQTPGWLREAVHALSTDKAARRMSTGTAATPGTTASSPGNTATDSPTPSLASTDSPAATTSENASGLALAPAASDDGEAAALMLRAKQLLGTMTPAKRPPEDPAPMTPRPVATRQSGAQRSARDAAAAARAAAASAAMISSLPAASSIQPLPTVNLQVVERKTIPVTAQPKVQIRVGDKRAATSQDRAAAETATGGPTDVDADASAKTRLSFCSAEVASDLFSNFVPLLDVIHRPPEQADEPRASAETAQCSVGPPMLSPRPPLPLAANARSSVDGQAPPTSLPHSGGGGASNKAASRYSKAEDGLPHPRPLARPLSSSAISSSTLTLDSTLDSHPATQRGWEAATGLEGDAATAAAVAHGLASSGELPFTEPLVQVTSAQLAGSQPALLGHSSTVQSALGQSVAHTIVMRRSSKAKGSGSRGSDRDKENCAPSTGPKSSQPTAISQEGRRRGGAALQRRRKQPSPTSSAMPLWEVSSAAQPSGGGVFLDVGSTTGEGSESEGIARYRGFKPPPSSAGPDEPFWSAEQPVLNTAAASCRADGSPKHSARARVSLQLSPSQLAPERLGTPGAALVTPRGGSVSHSARSNGAGNASGRLTSARSGLSAASTPTVARELRAVGGTVVRKARPKVSPTSEHKQELLQAGKLFRF